MAGEGPNHAGAGPRRGGEGAEEGPSSAVGAAGVPPAQLARPAFKRARFSVPRPARGGAAGASGGACGGGGAPAAEGVAEAGAGSGTGKASSHVRGLAARPSTGAGRTLPFVVPRPAQSTGQFVVPRPAQSTGQFVVPRPAEATTPARGGGAGSSGRVAKIARYTLSGPPPAAEPEYFRVLFAKMSRGSTKKLRKNMSWADGILEVRGSKCSLFGDDAKLVYKGEAPKPQVLAPLKYGSGDSVFFSVGWYEIEAEAPIQAAEFKNGSCFLGACGGGAPVSCANLPGIRRAPFKGVAGRANALKNRPQGLGKKPAGDSAVGAPESVLEEIPEELVVYRDAQGRTRGIPKFIGKHLRPHQLEGVRFLYSRALGLAEAGRTGAILADEMGLGKTIQVIAFICTCLPCTGPGLGIQKVLITVPSSLVLNWEQEFKKWTFIHIQRTILLPSKKDCASLIREFGARKSPGVIICSYELARKYAKQLRAVGPGLLVCDEGHRLKQAEGNTKTINALNSIDCRHKVLLTGTPMQNDLQEFYALVNFVIPGYLGELRAFKNIFETAVLKGRDAGASEEEKEQGQMRMEELQKRCRGFILRRTAEVNKKFLPPRTDLVVFCKLQSPGQETLYKAAISGSDVRKATHGSGCCGTEVLGLMRKVRAICSHPFLVGLEDGTEAGVGKSPSSVSAGESGKMVCMLALVSTILARGEAVVLVSGFVKVLRLCKVLLEGDPNLCGRDLNIGTIDGSMDAQSRQDAVQALNSGLCKVLLLSARAGGAGLNLIGASHLVLIDSDWNPAIDEQAKARVWRDGQKLPVFIYRLLSTGTIEEKIFQRQLVKGELGVAVAAEGQTEKTKHSNASKFSQEELRALFSYSHTECDTRDALLNSNPDAPEWDDERVVIQDDTGHPLHAALATGSVSFVYRSERE